MDDMPKTTFLLTAMGLTALYLWRTHRTPHNIDANAAQNPVQPSQPPPAVQTTPRPIGPLETVPSSSDPIKGFFDALGGLLGA